ncbi:MAG: carbon-nitrogen hydrolase family protein [Firmicutes bacterium]|nr:carbon-nitrogen hydrolase family protein [Bacillota bacterium]
MRKVILSATQAGDLPFDRRFDCLSDSFEADPAAILREHVLPRIEHSLGLLRRCDNRGRALALTNEDVCGLAYFLLADAALFDELAVLSAEAAEERYSKLAAERDMYVAACYFKRIGGKNYNVASVFGPNGQILGEYRKTHLPPNEMWQAEDGDCLNVIELDFCKAGALICYDMMFPEPASVLALSGAELILHPTAGYGWYDSIGEATLRTRANDNSVYILTAKNYVFNGAGKSGVIDRWGQTLADAGFYRDAVVSKEIDLDEPKTQPGWYYPSQMSGHADVRARYLEERRPELYGALTAPAKRLRVPDGLERAELREKVRKGECRW